MTKKPLKQSKLQLVMVSLLPIKAHVANVRLQKTYMFI
jgi:hypothetical protein